MSEAKRESVPVLTQVKAMAGSFWVANIIEAGERLAFFGVRAILPLFLYGEASVLGLTMTEKGIIFGVWALIQCLLPIVSGGYTESYGYKKSLYVAFAINISGYLLMAQATPENGFWMMMLAGICVGTGTAIFKPPVQGVVARSLDEGNSGLGFGIFYWVVNIGGFLAPMAAAWARGNELSPTWDHVFYGAAIVTAINYLPAMFLLREPERSPRPEGHSPLKVFSETMKVLGQDKAMLRFLLIISGFWFMFMQLWDLLPSFIAEWVDTRDVGSVLTATVGSWADSLLNAAGGAKPEILINIDSAVIILLVLPMTWFFARFRMIVSLVVGMAIALIGFVGAGLTQIGMVCGAMIFVFAVGEIICSPKFSEYIGMTAPPDKKALYMGYSNMPFAIGWFLGNIVSGPLYDVFASRITFARRFLVEEAGMSPDAVANIETGQLIETVAAKMGESATTYDAAQLLWSTYHPWLIWVMLGAVGIASLIGIATLYVRTGKDEQQKGIDDGQADAA